MTFELVIQLVRIMEKSYIRVLFQYEFKWGHCVDTTITNINRIYGQNVAWTPTVYRWFENFRQGDFDLERQPRGRPKTIVNDDDLVRQIVTNPRTTLRDLGLMFNVQATLSKGISRR